MKLTKSETKVLAFLRSRANEKGECYVYAREIAEGTGLSRGYVRQVTAQLRKRGVIQTEQMWEYLDNRDNLVVATEERALVETYGTDGDPCWPAGNLYRFTHEGRLAFETLCCVAWKWILAPRGPANLAPNLALVQVQLNLPFPTNQLNLPMLVAA